MFTKKNVLVACAALAAVIALTGFKAASARHHDPEKFHARINQKIDKELDELNATPDQRKEIHAIADQLWSERPQTKGQMQDFLSFWKQENPDPTAVHARIDQHMDEKRTFAHKMGDALLRVHSILTPEQRAKVTKQLTERHERRMKK